MARHFDPDGFGILRELTTGPQLQFRNDATGATYPARPEDTLLAGEDTGERRVMARHVNSLKNAAFDALNVGIEVPNGGCQDCGRTVVRMQQLGEQRKAIYICLCGRRWGN